MFGQVKVFFALPLAFTLAAGASSSAASPAATVNPTCVHSMDGKLPSPTPLGFKFSGNVRKYYVAAEEVEWNYAPTGWDNWMGVPLSMSPRASSFLDYNTTYTKALYREYTDATFQHRKEQPPWQGTQGPTLRSEVGDMVEIMFVNKLSTYYATMHSMGLSYNKMNDGSDYPGTTAPGQNISIPASDAVPPVNAGVGPGNCVVYKWMATDDSGPNAGEPARTHSYHSYVDLDTDSNSGLIGPQIVYAAGKMNETMAKYREFNLLYMIYDETMSFLSGVNAKKLSDNHTAGSMSSFGAIDANLWSGNYSIWHPQAVNLNGTGRFSDAPMFNTMNGYIFANNPEFQMCAGDQAIWYVNGWGGDSHVFHMHGNAVRVNGLNAYAVSLNDGIGQALYMNATGTGLWQVICHVSDHQQGGMVSNYRVFPNNCPLPKQGGKR